MPVLEIVNEKRWHLRQGPPIAINRDRVELDQDFEVIYSYEVAVSAGGCIYKTPQSPQKSRTTWTFEELWIPEDDTEIDLDKNGEGFYQELMGEMSDSRVFKQAATNLLKEKNAKKSEVLVRNLSCWMAALSLILLENKHHPHVIWKEKYISGYLDKLLHHEDWGDSHHMLECPDCLAQASLSMNEAEIHCRDCFLGDLVCKSCCRCCHQQNPLHSIEVSQWLFLRHFRADAKSQRWNGTFFKCISLKDIGPHVQLNCHSMHYKLLLLCHQVFKVLHTNSIHWVAVNYCGCERQILHHIQLLCCGWYPVSLLCLQTYASMRLLKVFHPPPLGNPSGEYYFGRGTFCHWARIQSQKWWWKQWRRHAQCSVDRSWKNWWWVVAATLLCDNKYIY